MKYLFAILATLILVIGCSDEDENSISFASPHEGQVIRVGVVLDTTDSWEGPWYRGIWSRQLRLEGTRVGDVDSVHWFEEYSNGRQQIASTTLAEYDTTQPVVIAVSPLDTFPVRYSKQMSADVFFSGGDIVTVPRNFFVELHLEP